MLGNASKRSASDEHVPLNHPHPRLSPDRNVLPSYAAAPFSLPTGSTRCVVGWEEMRRGMRKSLTNAARTSSAAPLEISDAARSAAVLASPLARLAACSRSSRIVASARR